jgi:addiction module HigA family antidote
MTDQLIAPIHPGEHLAEFLSDLGIDEQRAATELRIPRIRIDEIIRGEREITADTALRLGRYFGTSASFWMTLQDKYELELAAEAIGAEVELIQRVA